MEFIDATQLARFLAALVFVVALMIGLSLVMKRVNGQALTGHPRKRRLQVVETLTLDARHRAVLLRRDNREHLVILNGTTETVIETGIETSIETGIESPQDKAHDTNPA